MLLNIKSRISGNRVEFGTFLTHNLGWIQQREHNHLYNVGVFLRESQGFLLFGLPGTSSLRESLFRWSPGVKKEHRTRKVITVNVRP